MPAFSLVYKIEKELDKALLSCQEGFNQNVQVISFSQKVDLVDPLVILEKVALKSHFYWESPSQEEAIIGYGITRKTTINSGERFTKARQFIQTCLQQTIRTGDFHLKGAGPRFWCSFSFFGTAAANAPFPAATVFLPRIQIVRQKQTCILVANVAVDKTINTKLVLEQIRQEIQTINLSNCKAVESATQPVRLEAKLEAAPLFKSAVASALKSIHKKEFSKIVLAHATDVLSATPFNIIHSLHNLRQRHSDCYIFSTSNGKGHTFIGASPERLISIQNQTLITDALAGSAPRGKTASEDASFASRLLSSQKEQREHQAVTQFIIQRLRQLDLMPERSPRQLLQLSNIQHLWTQIYAQLPPHVNPLDIVDLLHPTPAVAGVPTQRACEQIRRYETFDRGLYAAPLGWIDYQGNSHFIVGIRSALIKGNHARLYAGAGIVAGSDPDKEFAEVQLKLQSLLKALV